MVFLVCLVITRRAAEIEFGNWQARSDVMTSGLTRRATSKPPPPNPKAKPKASPTPIERRAWEAVGRVTRRPRSEWNEAARVEIRNFRGHGRDYFEQAMEIAEMNEASFPAASVHFVNRDPDHVDQGGGLGMSRSLNREVVQGVVQDPDLATAPIVLGQPAARITPTTTMTTVDWERISAEDPWTQEPHTPREVVEF